MERASPATQANDAKRRGDPQSPVVLEVQEAVKTFSQGPAAVRALDGVDLRVNSGEFVAIMGASGSGKSTLLHVVAGLTSIDKGVVKVAGEDIGSLGDKQLSSFRRRTIGLVFQAFNLIPTLSAEDNVALPGLGDHEVRSRAAQLLDRLGLADRRHHHPDALSGGEQQRVAIARALVMNPPLMLADEPTGSLDSVAGQDLCRLLYELRSEQQRTVVVVTHEPTVAMWADRVIVLADGRCRTQFVPKGDHDPVALSDAYQQALRSDLA